MTRTFQLRLTRRRIMAGGAASLLLAGCSSIVGPVSYKLYVLKPEMPPHPPRRAVKWQLSIAVPQLAESLDTERIALSRTPETLDYYAGVQWTDRLSLLVQSSLLEAFETGGGVSAVARDTSGLRADYLLQPEIRDFEARYAGGDGPPEILVRIAVRLVRMPARDIVGTLLAEDRATAAANDLPAIVAAFDTASGAVLARIVEWTLATAGG